MSHHEHKQITLDQLQGQNTNQIAVNTTAPKELSMNEINTLIPEEKKKPEDMMGFALTGDLEAKFAGLTSQIASEREEIAKEFEDRILEEEDEKRTQKASNPTTMDELLYGKDDDEEVTTDKIKTEPAIVVPKFDEPVKKEVVEPVDDFKLVIPEDKPEVAEDEEDDEETDSFSAMRELVSEKIKSSKKVIDLSKFTISKKTISSSNAFESTTDDVFAWVLPSANEMFASRQYKGDDVDALVEKQTENVFLERDRIYKVIYSHLYGVKKTYREWIKSLLFFDQDDLFFGIYKATFSGANYLPYQCTECKHTFASDNLPMESLVKYKNEEAKARIQSLVTRGETIPEKREVSLEPLNDKFVIGIKMPSVFDITFAYTVLEEDFVAKYNDILTINSFIDSIYVINTTTMELDPVDFKEYPDNLRKTVTSKIRKVAQLVKSLSTDEYNDLKAIVEKYTTKFADRDVTYVLPEAVCPKCGKVLPEEEISAQSLLFIRHQLTAGAING